MTCAWLDGPRGSSSESPAGSGGTHLGCKMVPCCRAPSEETNSLLQHLLSPRLLEFVALWFGRHCLPPSSALCAGLRSLHRRSLMVGHSTCLVLLGPHWLGMP